MRNAVIWYHGYQPSKIKFTPPMISEPSIHLPFWLRPPMDARATDIPSIPMLVKVKSCAD